MASPLKNIMSNSPKKLRRQSLTYLSLHPAELTGQLILRETIRYMVQKAVSSTPPPPNPPPPPLARRKGPEGEELLTMKMFGVIPGRELSLSQSWEVNER